MKHDKRLKHDVEEAILVESLLNAVNISVTANEGIITLSGTVDSYVKKSAAIQIANKVPGVLAVTEQIKVKFEADDINLSIT